MIQRFTLIVTVTLFSLTAYTQVFTPDYCEARRGLYVDGNYWGNASEENTLLDFAVDYGFNYLILYDVDLNEPASISAFIKKAKNEFGIREIGVVMETALFVEDYVNYNLAHDIDERFDVFNMEFEFWSSNLSGLQYCGYLSGPCDRDNAFSFYIDQLRKMDEAGDSIGVKSETYIGWPNQNEAIQIAETVDRVLVHFYRPSVDGIINYGLDRLEHLSQGDSLIEVSPIFSSEGTGNTADLPFMGDWLFNHPVDEAYESWFSQYNNLTGAWRSDIYIPGSVWFTYGRFIQDHENHVSASPQSNELAVGATQLLTVQSSADSTKYFWYKNNVCLVDGEGVSGARTKELLIENVSMPDSGTYHCRVVSYDSANPGTFISDKSYISVINEQRPYSNHTIPGIIEAEEFDIGGQNIAHFEQNIRRQSTNKSFRPASGVDIEDCSEGGFNVSFCPPGEWLEYTVDVSAGTNYLGFVRVASFTSGSFHLEIDGVEVTGEVNVANTGGWQQWETVTTPSFPLTEGKHILRLVMGGGVNFNNIQIDLITNTELDYHSNDVSVFPNPSQSGRFNLSKKTDGTIFNGMGERLFSFKQAELFDLEQYPAGIYFIRVDDKFLKVFNRRSSIE